MITCAELKEEMLPNRMGVHDPEIKGFDRARERADLKARESLVEPMLLGWYDRRTGTFSPRVECCSEDKPGWVVYAESRGGCLTVDVNGGSYYFIYRDASPNPAA